MPESKGSQGLYAYTKARTRAYALVTLEGIKTFDQSVVLIAGANGDSQEVTDPRLVEMANDDALLSQLCCDLCAFVVRMTSKHEVCLRRQHFKAPLLKLFRHSLPLTNHTATRIFKPLLVFKCGNGANQRQTVQRIGVEAILNPIQSLDQLFITHRKADAQPCQRTGLGESLANQQVRILVYQTNRRITAEVHVSFVYHHHAVRVGLQDLFHVLQAQVATSRRVRVREDDATVGAFVVFRVDLEAVGERNDVTFDLVQAAVHGIEAVGDVWKQDRFIVFQQTLKNVRKNFVRAVADEHLLCINRKINVVVGDRFFQRLAFRVRIQAQVVVQLFLNRFDHLRRRTKRIFIGVQLHQISHFWLFARYIRLQFADQRAPVFTHIS